MKGYAALLFVALPLAVSSDVMAATITFDDINTSGSFLPMPNGYMGFTWDNWNVIRPSPSYAPVSGYAAGTVSPPNVVNNPNAQPATISSATPFTLNSGFFTGAWNDGLNLTIQGFNGATLMDSTTIVVNSTAPTLETFNWADLTSVTFNSFGGVQHPTYAGSGAHFVLDNLTINAAPEPGTFAMIVAPFGALFLLRRKSLRG